jgi:hypothetical protein
MPTIELYFHSRDQDMRPEPFKKWTRPVRLRLRLSRYLRDGLNAWYLNLIAGIGPWDVVEIARDDRAIVLRLPGLNEIEDNRVHFYYRTFLPVIVYLFSRTKASVNGAIAELKDGSTTASNHLLFSGNCDDAVLVPDPEFFNTHGYAILRQKTKEQRPWHERNDQIIWRGATSGSGRLIDDSLDWHASDIRQRIRMCGILRSLSDIDAKIYRVVQVSDPDEILERLKRAELFGDYVAGLTWLDQKFAIDVDGNANAWSNLFTRLLYGCCVIKIASPQKYRQWYYHRMVPWKHFVPVQANLSDLIERIEWCRSHLVECREIATSGQELALSMTFDTETRYTIDMINQRLG